MGSHSVCEYPNIKSERHVVPGSINNTIDTRYQQNLPSLCQHTKQSVPPRGLTPYGARPNWRWTPLALEALALDAPLLTILPT